MFLWGWLRHAQCTLHPSSSTPTAATGEHETSVLTPNTPMIHLTTFLNLEHQRTQEVGLRDTRQASEVKLAGALSF
ncbi:hypothetical protein ILYODFUR_034628 [Ilyodon furcidens]|uniref:Secreted protein n=1 Tax=Ilyodon furcidens TaxID=33524 RepID=A0ABV0U2Z8_9TELE